MRSNPPAPRRMVLVPREDVVELATLARAVVELHDRKTHYGRCDVCDLVERWRGRLRGPIDVDGMPRAEAS